MDQETRLQAREHSKAYYERLKQDPERLAARNARIAEKMRLYRAKKRAKSETTPGVQSEITRRESETTHAEPENGWYTITRTGQVIPPKPKSETTVAKSETTPEVVVQKSETTGLRARAESETTRSTPGGKHDPPATQGELSLSMESIAELWHDNWDKEELIQERAAIMEFDGGLGREEAERAAREALERLLFG
jgi:hypothetical protein